MSIPCKVLRALEAILSKAMAHQVSTSRVHTTRDRINIRPSVTTSPPHSSPVLGKVCMMMYHLNRLLSTFKINEQVCISFIYFYAAFLMCYQALPTHTIASMVPLQMLRRGLRIRGQAAIIAAEEGAGLALWHRWVGDLVLGVHAVVSIRISVVGSDSLKLLRSR